MKQTKNFFFLLVKIKIGLFYQKAYFAFYLLSISILYGERHHFKYDYELLNNEISSCLCWLKHFPKAFGSSQFGILSTSVIWMDSFTASCYETAVNMLASVPSSQQDHCSVLTLALCDLLLSVCLSLSYTHTHTQTYTITALSVNL